MTQQTLHRNRLRTIDELGPHYKWIALSNTTLGMLIATINSSIVLIALPDIFKGIHLNPTFRWANDTQSTQFRGRRCARCAMASAAASITFLRT